MNEHTATQVEQIISKLPGFAPELYLIGGLLLVVITDLVLGKSTPQRKGIMGGMSLVVITAVFLSIEIGSVQAIFKYILLVGTALCMILMIREDDFNHPAEHFTLVLGILLGAFFLINSETLLTFYLSIELMSIGGYALTALRLGKKGTEAGMKYLLFGATSSAIMLFGMSLIYGFSGSIVWSEISMTTMITNVGKVPAVVSLGLLLVGFLFKIAAAPLHIWSPDVYQTARTSIVAFFSIIPKLAGIFALYLIFFNNSLYSFDIIRMLGIVAMMSMIVGNTAALWQSDTKRMLAYSSIAHSGFLLIPIVAGEKLVLQSLLFYATIYLLMNVAVFGLTMILEKNVGTTTMSKYRGLGKHFPFIGILLLVVMIALTGLPPTAGFTAKLLVFTTLWGKFTLTTDNFYIILLVIGITNTVISLFYYLKIPYFMFVKSKTEEVPLKNNSRNFLIYFTAIIVLIILALFFRSDLLMGLLSYVNFDL